MIDKKVLQGSVYHTETREKGNKQTDVEIEGTSSLLPRAMSNKDADIDIRQSCQANCCLNYLL